MRVFKTPRARFAVLMADLEMESADMPAAEKKFRRLLADREFQSNPEMAAYCSFALSVALECQVADKEKRKESEAILEKFLPGKPFSQTVIAPRALLRYANSIQDFNDPKNLVRRMKCYEYIVKTFPKHEAADYALFYQASPFYLRKQYAEAIPGLEAYLKRFPEGKFAKAAKEFLADAKAKLAK